MKSGNSMAKNMEDSSLQKKKQELWEALQEQETDTVRHILCHGVKVNCKLTDNHVTPLHYCAQVGDEELFKWLLSKGASVSKRDRWMDTVLHYACKYNQVSIVKIIVSVLKEQNMLCKCLHVQGKKGYTPVMWVVANRRFDPFFKHIVKTCDLTNEAEFRTQVIKCLFTNKREKHQVLLLDQLCESNKMLLFKEISKCDVDQQKNAELCKVAQNIVHNFSQDDKEKCVEHVASTGSVSVLTMLLKSPIGYSVKCIKASLLVAIEQKHFQIAEMLIDAGPDVEYEEQQFITCFQKGNSHLLKKMLCVTRTFPFWSEESHQRLMYAAVKEGSEESVHIIGDTLGTDFVKSCSKALDLALKIKSLPLYMYFKDKGLKLSERIDNFASRLNYFGYSHVINNHPMALAVETGNIEFVNLLITENVPESREDCIEVIKAAIEQQNENIIDILLSHMEEGILNFDNSIFAKAVMTKNVDFVKSLMRHGLKLSSEVKENYRTKSTLQAAVETGILEMVELCCQEEVAISRDGFELEVSIRMNCLDILKLLLKYKGREVFQHIVHSKREMSPLHEAVVKENKKALEIIFDYASLKDPISEFLQKNGNSLIYIALEKNNKDILNLLLQNGAEIKEPQNSQVYYSPYGYYNKSVFDLLHCACKQDDCDIVSLLIKHGAEINKDILKQLSRKHEIKNTDIWKEIVSSFLETDCIDSLSDVLHEACHANNTDLVRELRNHTLMFDDTVLLLDCLYYAISNKNTELMELLLEIPYTDVNKICFVNTKDINFRMRQMINDYGSNLRPIHLAVAQSTEMCKILLAHGADPNVKTEKGMQPIHIAVMNQQTDVIALLLQNKETMHSEVIKKRCQRHLAKSSLLHIAMKLQDLETVNFLLEHTGQSLVNLVDNVSKTPLFYIANWKDIDFDTTKDVFKRIINAGADINHLGKNGNSVLAEAFREGNTTLIHILLNSGLKTSIIQSLNWNHVEKYIKQGSYDIIKDLLACGYNLRLQINKTNFSIKSLSAKKKKQTGAVVMIKCLLENGARVNYFTLLKGCATKNWRELAEVLIYHESEENDLAISQFFPRGHLQPEQVNMVLDIALEKHHVEITKLFLDAGATFDSSKIVIQIVKSVKHAADENIVKCVSETIDKVIQEGADVNAVDEKGQTGLILASESNLLWLVQKLIQHNCNLDATSGNKERYRHFTAVQIACMVRHYEIAQMLIQHGASCGSTKSNMHMTLLHCIAKKQHSKPKKRNRKKQIKKQKLSEVVECVSDKEAKFLQDIVEKGVDIDAVSEEGWTALHYAVHNNDLDLTKILITLQCDINVTTKAISKFKPSFQNCTAIQIAAKKGFIDIVDYLLARSCTVQLVDTTGKTLLHNIAHSNTKNKKELLQLCVERITRAGIDVNATDHNGKSALNYAVEENNEMLVKLLLDFQVDLNKEKHSSLLTAAESHKHKFMKYFFEYGAKVNLCDQKNETCLHHICKKWNTSNPKHAQKYSETVLLLLIAGADINIQNKRNETPVEIVSMHGNVEALELLVQHGEDTKLFPKDGKSYINACKSSEEKYKMARILQTVMDKELLDSHLNNDLALIMNEKLSCSEVVKLLLRMGGNPNQKSTGDNTLLHIACESQHNLQILQLLLSFRANLNLTNMKQETPLHVACRKGNMEAMQLFLKYGAISDVQDANGWTPLHICAHRSNKRGVEMLVKYEATADIGTKTSFEGVKEHSTPLMICLESHGYYTKDIASLLIHKGANPNVTDRNGNNILLIAVDRHYGVSYIEFLTGQRININHQNNNGWGALHHAVTNSASDVVNFLITHNCNINIQITDNEPHHGGQTALHIAFKTCNLQLIQLLLINGADRFLNDTRGKTPVQCCFDASNNYKKDIIKSVILAIRAGGHIKTINGKKFLNLIQHSESLTDMLMQSGCEIGFGNNILNNENDDIEKFINKQQVPLTLMRLAANAVRTNVRPNALHSAKRLPLPESIITFLTFENVSTEVESSLGSYYGYSDYGSSASDSENEDNY